MADQYEPKLGKKVIGLWKNPKWGPDTNLPYFSGKVKIPVDAKPGDEYDIAIWVNDKRETEKHPHMTGNISEKWVRNEAAAPVAAPKPAAAKPAFDDDIPF